MYMLSLCREQILCMVEHVNFIQSLVTYIAICVIENGIPIYLSPWAHNWFTNIHPEHLYNQTSDRLTGTKCAR